MNVVKKLNDLQDIDLEIKRSQEEIEKVQANLGLNTDLLSIKEEHLTLSARMSELRKHKQEIEWDIDDLNKHISQISSKLYGGTIKNPKELLGLEQDLEALKKRVSSKEDLLLDYMENEEEIQNQLNKLNHQLAEAEEQWKIQSDKMRNIKNQLETNLDRMQNERNLVVSEISPDILKIYERLFLRKGCAIVKVEQGRCQGCRISLPMNDLQRARSGNIIQCSSCGMILYL